MTIRSGWGGGIGLPQPMNRSEVEGVLRRFIKRYGGELIVVQWHYTTDAYFVYRHPDHDYDIEIKSPGGIDGSPYLSENRADPSLTLHYGFLAESFRKVFTERLAEFFQLGEKSSQM